MYFLYSISCSLFDYKILFVINLFSAEGGWTHGNDRINTPILNSHDVTSFTLIGNITVSLYEENNIKSYDPYSDWNFIEVDSVSEEEELEESARVEVNPSYGVGSNENEDLSEKIPDTFENEEFAPHDNVEEINKEEGEEERDTDDPFGFIRLLEKEPVQNIGLENVGESDNPFLPPGYTPLSDGAKGNNKVDRCSENQLKESPSTDAAIGVDVSHLETKSKSNIPISEKFA
ncbi:hypothetical protein L6452_13149 [Arctium lappa]|uniref:Uncharacterized protein n=1 Tax=Arctium lappa TaxID=4217 RepID=A0ACB9CHS2_ARCLA|nr:hypothetical protein L6452_13149 [Arctium lappa]